MRRSLTNFTLNLVCLILFGAMTSMSAQDAQTIVNNHLTDVTQYNGATLTPGDIADFEVLSDHISSTSGVHHYYFIQNYRGINIWQTNSSCHEVNGAMFKSHIAFLENLESLSKDAPNPSITAQDAVMKVSEQMDYGIAGVPDIVTDEGGPKQKVVLEKLNIALEDIPVNLVYYPVEGGNGTELKLCWEMYVVEIDESKAYHFIVDADDGSIMNQYNMVLECGLGNCTHEGHDHDSGIKCEDEFIGPVGVVAGGTTSAMMVGGYNVIPLPIESPGHGSRAIINDPDDAIASPFGWHDTNGAPGSEFTVTEGNNCNAYEDGDNPGFQPDGGVGLMFNFPFNPVYSAGDQSESAAITNLFYWNNICHDILHYYGFDAPSGNFQTNNYGAGGLGGDEVHAEAQDASGSCNANMLTFPDGGLARMQMYTCGNRDGDWDNGVIVHEYIHGLSIRLTGGPATSGCLSNQEQMGEGWSDYYALMFTMETGDMGPDARGIGTWLFGQGPGGPGIRTHPYSTNMGVNPHTYDDIMTESIPHGVGSVWCAMLWDMTWDLIDLYGFDSDFYTGTGGNNIALDIVTEALKLQPCSPGFVDGRDAIIAADAALYGGANECLIWEAFARRGLGFSASQGSSGSRSDGVEAFDLPPSCQPAMEPGDYPDCPAFYTSLGDYSVPAGSTVIFDTDALTYDGNPGGVLDNGTAVYSFDNLTVPAGATIRAIGSAPIALMASGDITVDGTIDLDGENSFDFRTTPTEPGAGGFPGGVGGAGGMGPGGGNPGIAPAGSGGGGHGGQGGDGGNSTGGTGGTGGVAYGDLTVSFCGGGSGGSSGTSSPATGGAGGGGLFLGAQGSVTISASGIVTANGGTGATSGQGGSGGASGGAIIIDATTFNHDGILRANGGAGGGGGCCGDGGGGAGGRIYAATIPAGAGTIETLGGIAGGFGFPPQGDGEDGEVGVVTRDDVDLFSCFIKECPADTTINCDTDTSTMTLGVPVCGNPDGLILYGTDGFTSQLVEIDITTGTSTTIGTMPGLGNGIGIAYNPNTDVTYVRDFDQLFTVDLMTASTTLVGPSGTFITSLTFDQNYTTLYSVDQSSMDFYTVDPNTGTATMVGNTGIAVPLCLSTDASGTIWAVDINANIYTIDPTTAASTLQFATVHPNGATAIDIHPNTGLMYLVTLSGELLVEVDLTTGTATTIGGPLGISDCRGLDFIGECGPCPDLTYEDVIIPGECGNEYTIERTFTTTDEEDIEHTCVQTIMVQDTTPPVVIAPADTTINCEDTCHLAPLEGGGGTLAGVVAMRSQVSWPWGLTSNYTSEMNTVFGPGNWSEELYETANPNTIFNASTSYVYMEGGDNNANVFNSFLQANLPLIESWVNSGGLLFLNAAPNQGGNINLGFGGVTLIYPDFTATVEATDPAHPVFTGPYQPTVTTMTGSWYGHSIICPNPMTSIIQDDTGTKDVLVETQWGNGHVMFGGMTSWFFHNPDPQGENAKYNMHAHLLAQLGGGPCTGTAMARDCGVETLEYSDATAPGSCPQETIITRTWTATDSCGNTGTDVQIITLQDTTPPMVMVPNDTTINCLQECYIDTSGGGGPRVGETFLMRSSLGYPWGQTTVYQTEMNTVFGAGNWTEELYESAVATDIFTTATSYVYMLGGANNGLRLKTFFESNRQLINDWVDGGGRLVVNGAPFSSPAVNIDFGFGGVMMMETANSSTGTALIPGHPIFNGPNTPVGTVWTGGSFSHNIICPPGMVGLIGGNGPPNAILLAELPWGNGHTMFGSMTATNFHSPQPQATNLKWNILEYMTTQGGGGGLSEYCTGNATATDNCDPDPQIMVRDEIIPGACENEFTVNRYWSAVDSCGNESEEVIQVIEIIDTIPPVAVCNDTTIILDDWNKASVTAEDIGGDSFDECGGDVMLEIDRDLFRCADLGPNTVTLTVTDVCGNMSTCTATVTVLDTTRPTLTCVPVTLQAGPGDCELLIEDVTILTDGYDNCTYPIVIREVPGGDYGSWDYWPLGTHEVWLVGEDESGNVSDTCKLQVTIEPFENPVTALFCNDFIQFSLDETCMTTLTADMILEGGPYTCYELYEVLVEDDRGNIQDLDGDLSNGTQLGWEHIGKCFKVTVRDQFNTNNRCWGTVCIEDKMRPMIEDCMDVTVDCGENTDPLCFGGDIPCPIVFDNCDPILEASYVDWETLGSCEAGYDRIISRRWTFTDDWGNVNTCEQVITVGLGDLFSVAVPGDYDDVSNPALLCDEKYDENKDVSPHILDFPFCVDGYLLDSAVWFATGGDPTITNPDARDLSGDRVPMTLGWNCMDQGKYIGHPSPSTIYYDPHPQWEFFGVCWGPEEIVKWTGTGYPSPADCGNIQYTYRDTKIDLSDPDCNAGAVGCFKILRQWTVIDWCSGDVGGHDQIIKILDKEGPQIVMPDELEVGTDVWKCEGVVPIPAPWISDNCSEDVDYNLVIKTGQVTGNSQDGYTVVGLELGEHTLYIQAFDCCGNRSVDSITLNVVDNTPPVAVCEDRVQLSLTGNQSPGSNFSSICAEDLDQSSYDNCTDWLWFKMIRMDELLGTVNGSFADNTGACSGVNGDDDAIISGNQVYFDDCSKFCCEDADQIVMVVLRVHDMDPGAGPVSPARYASPAGDLVGRFTDCWVEIEVVDKAQPIVVAPPDMVVSCMFWFDDSEDALSDPSNATFGRVVTSLNAREKVKTIDVVCEQWCEDHPKYDYEPSRNTPVIWSQACDFYNSYYDAAHPDDKYELVWGFDGYAIRTCGAMPEIRVDDRRECGQGVILRDVIVSYQDPKTGGVVSFRDRQEIWVIDCDPFYVNTDDCFDDEDCIQWPLFCQQPDPLDGCGADLDPYTNPQLGAPVIENGCDDNCALVAVDYVDEIYTIEPDACFKVIRTWIIIDWCQYDPLAPKEYDGDNPNTVTEGRWEYVQSIVVRDKIDPVITTQVGDCEPAEYVDSLGTCVSHIEICAEATDDCSPDSWIVYDYKIDAFSDGVGQFGDFDFYVGKLTRRQDSLGQNLTQGPLDCEAYNQGGYCNPFADDPTQPFCASGTYPLGTHTIYWFAEDGCGNVTKDTTVFDVLDCKQPTPYCKTGIITVVMPVNGEICVWANDLDDGSFDNCTAQEDLKFYFNGDTSMTSYCVNCDTFAARGGGDKILFDVEVWVEDEEGNADFCITTIEVQDNMDVCEDSMTVTTITGQIENPLSGEMVEGVDVLLNGQLEDETASDGLFFFTTGLDLADVEVSGYHNERPLNGVSTADLVGIQRHLLGKKAFTSGYQMIAADVNNSEDVSAADIVALRQVILGMEDDFTRYNGQTSWRFADQGENLADNPDPWPFTEVLGEAEITAQGGESDFHGIKIGDVNGDAQSNGLTGSSTRGNATVTLVAEDVNLEVGETYTMEVTSDNFAEVSGYQFTMSYDASTLRYTGVESGVLRVNGSNVGTANVANGMITMSWNELSGEAVSVGTDKVLFTVTFEVLTEAKASESVNINSVITAAEAYDADVQVKGLNLEFRDGGEVVEVFDLYQNVPNPFKGSTVIGFTLPSEMTAILTVYDVSGKVLLVRDVDGKRGYNEEMIRNTELNGAGVLYYQLDAEDYTATKRMVLID